MLHHGGGLVRGMEVVFLQSARTFAAAGYRVVVFRNNDCIDHALETITPAPEIVTFRFPELMIDGMRRTSLPIRSYITAHKRLKTLVRNHSTTLLYCSGGLPCQLGVPVARQLGIPLVCHLHHPAMKRERYLWLAMFADELIFPSAFTRRHTLANRHDRGRVIYNGIDLSKFHPTRGKEPHWRSDLGIPANATVIGQVAALVKNKRPDFLISVFNTLRNTTRAPLHLCLVGGGPMKERLLRQASELGIGQHVTLTGYVDDVLPYYQHVFDVNVLVSREEGLGISVIEGSACGLPAVVTNCTGLTETVLENQTGFLFDLNDDESLQRQLLRLIDAPDLRASMGAAGAAFAAQQFSSGSYDRNFMTAVTELLQRTRRSA